MAIYSARCVQMDKRNVETEKPAHAPQHMQILRRAIRDLILIVQNMNASVASKLFSLLVAIFLIASLRYLRYRQVLYVT